MTVAGNGREFGIRSDQDGAKPSGGQRMFVSVPKARSAITEASKDGESEQKQRSDEQLRLLEQKKENVDEKKLKEQSQKLTLQQGQTSLPLYRLFICTSYQQLFVNHTVT